MKKRALIRSLPFFALALVSCGETSSLPGYSLESDSLEGEASYQYGESFHEGSLFLRDSSGGTHAVTSSMLIGFDTESLSFDTPLTAQVSYEGFSYPFTYRITPTYTLDKANYSLRLQSDGTLEVTLVGPNILAASASDYAMPETIATLPSPLNRFKLTRWSASFAGFANLKNVTFSSSLESFSTREDTLPSSILFHPASSGQLTYDLQGFLKSNGVLWGIKDGLTGILSLPETSSFSPNAFNGELEGIVAVDLPLSYATYDFSSCASRLAHNQAFNLASEHNGYYTNGGFLYQKSSTSVLCSGVPYGYTVKDGIFSFPSGLTRFYWDNLAGFAREDVSTIAFPDSLRSLAITSGKTLKDNAFATLILPSPSVVSLTSLVLNAFPSSLKTVKVPQSLRESYESDYDWKKLLTQGVSFVSI